MIKQAEVNIHMPYVPEISVNKAYRKGSPRYGKLPEVEYWLYRLKATMMEESQKFGPPVGNVTMDLYLFAPYLYLTFIYLRQDRRAGYQIRATLENFRRM